jgi:hypothetical protein
MTTLEKEIILEMLDFEETLVLFKRFFLWFNKFTPVKNIYFVKGLKDRKSISCVKPTKQGLLSDNRFMLEVDGKIWIKHLNNG